VTDRIGSSAHLRAHNGPDRSNKQLIIEPTFRDADAGVNRFRRFVRTDPEAFVRRWVFLAV
jgi:hypothetical protein